jgi:hypothetical protein
VELVEKTVRPLRERERGGGERESGEGWKKKEGRQRKKGI